MERQIWQREMELRQHSWHPLRNSPLPLSSHRPPPLHPSLHHYLLFILHLHNSFTAVIWFLVSILCMSILPHASTHLSCVFSVYSLWFREEAGLIGSDRSEAHFHAIKVEVYNTACSMMLPFSNTEKMSTEFQSKCNKKWKGLFWDIYPV